MARNEYYTSNAPRSSQRRFRYKFNHFNVNRTLLDGNNLAGIFFTAVPTHYLQVYIKLHCSRPIYIYPLHSGSNLCAIFWKVAFVHFGVAVAVFASYWLCHRSAIR